MAVDRTNLAGSTNRNGFRPMFIHSVVAPVEKSVIATDVRLL